VPLGSWPGPLLGPCLLAVTSARGTFYFFFLTDPALNTMKGPPTCTTLQRGSVTSYIKRTNREKELEKKPRSRMGDAFCVVMRWGDGPFQMRRMVILSRHFPLSLFGVAVLRRWGCRQPPSFCPLLVLTHDVPPPKCSVWKHHWPAGRSLKVNKNKIK
jgi:hypothetical protein